MAKIDREIGSTSEIWQIFIQDTSSATGGGLTGLVFNSSGLTAYYHRDTDTTATAISLVTMTVGTFTSGGFKEVDSVNTPGLYQFCPTNASLASGASTCYFQLQGATNMAPLPIEVDLNAEVRLAGGVTHGNSSAMLRLGSTSATPALYVTNSLSTASAAAFENTLDGGSVGLGQGTNGVYMDGDIGLLVEGGVISASFQAPQAISLDDGGGTGTGSIAGYLKGVASPTFTGPGVSTQQNFYKNRVYANFAFLMTDSITHEPKIDLTVTATRAIDGGSFAACTNSVSAMSNGWYKINLSASDLNGDSIVLRFTAVDADDTGAFLATQST